MRGIRLDKDIIKLNENQFPKLEMGPQAQSEPEARPLRRAWPAVPVVECPSPHLDCRPAVPNR